MEIMTVLAYRGEHQILEMDEEITSHATRQSVEDIANGIRYKLDCTRVIILGDGQVVADTNN